MRICIDIGCRLLLLFFINSVILFSVVGAFCSVGTEQQLRRFFGANEIGKIGRVGDKDEDLGASRHEQLLPYLWRMAASVALIFASLPM